MKQRVRVAFDQIVTEILVYLVQDRPSTKVHAEPGGGSSLGYLFGGGGDASK